jgi:hypothetical protein
VYCQGGDYRRMVEHRISECMHLAGYEEFPSTRKVVRWARRAHARWTTLLESTRQTFACANRVA